jgi:hypothetical protein
MKKKFTISVALLFIASMSFAQSNSNSVSNDYAYASNSQFARPANLFSNNIYEKVSDNNSLNVEAKVNKNDIQVSPGLAHSQDKILIKNLAEPCNIQIRDYAGRLIQQLSSTGDSVQILNLKNGNYFVSITGAHSGNSLVKKLSVIN